MNVELEKIFFVFRAFQEYCGLWIQSSGFRFVGLGLNNLMRAYFSVHSNLPLNIMIQFDQDGMWYWICYSNKIIKKKKSWFASSSSLFDLSCTTRGSMKNLVEIILELSKIFTCKHIISDGLLPVDVREFLFSKPRKYLSVSLCNSIRWCCEYIQSCFRCCYNN